jgi:hypothetical protein
MTNIKEVIELALNDGYLKPRYKVQSVEVGRTLITVDYLDTLSLEELIITQQFSI